MIGHSCMYLDLLHDQSLFTRYVKLGVISVKQPTIMTVILEHYFHLSRQCEYDEEVEVCDCGSSVSLAGPIIVGGILGLLIIGFWLVVNYITYLKYVKLTYCFYEYIVLIMGYVRRSAELQSVGHFATGTRNMDKSNMPYGVLKKKKNMNSYKQ